MYLLIIFILLFENVPINCVKTKVAKRQKPLAKMLRGGEISIGPQLENYFNGDGVKRFDKAWNQYQIPLESYITNVLQDGYTSQVLPAEVNSKISAGFLVSDTTVDVLFQDMFLRELPYISSKVNLWVPFNYLSLSGYTMNKIFIDTNYILFRNQCDIRFGTGGDDPTEFSPFTQNQVLERGSVTLIAEDCRVNGTVIVSLSGPSVALRHSTITLEQCAFSVEISSPGQGLPPVIAPYFNKQKRLELMRLINKPLRNALNARLETILYSNIVNEDLYSRANETDFKDQQQEIFKSTANFVTTVVIKKLNEMTIARNKGTFKLPDSKHIKAAKEMLGNTHESKIQVYDVILQGLESAYSPNVGGPYKDTQPMILYSIVYYRLVARGKISIKNGTSEGELTFSAELKDVAADVTFDLYEGDHKAHVVGWRDLDYFIHDLKSLEAERETANAMLNGYLSQEVPLALEMYIREMISGIFRNEVESQPKDNECVTHKQDGENGKKNDDVDAEVKVARSNASVASGNSSVVNDTDIIMLSDGHVEGDQQTQLNLKISFDDLAEELPDSPLSTTKRSAFWFEAIKQDGGLQTAKYRVDEQSSMFMPDSGFAKTLENTAYESDKKVINKEAILTAPHDSSFHTTRAKVIKKRKHNKSKTKLKKKKYSKRKGRKDPKHKTKKVKFEPVPISNKKKLNTSARSDHAKRLWYRVHSRNEGKHLSAGVHTRRKKRMIVN